MTTEVTHEIIKKLKNIKRSNICKYTFGETIHSDRDYKFACNFLESTFKNKEMKYISCDDFENLIKDIEKTLTFQKDVIR